VAFGHPGHEDSYVKRGRGEKKVQAFLGRIKCPTGEAQRMSDTLRHRAYSALAAPESQRGRKKENRPEARTLAHRLGIKSSKLGIEGKRSSMRNLVKKPETAAMKLITASPQKGKTGGNKNSYSNWVQKKTAVEKKRGLRLRLRQAA